MHEYYRLPALILLTVLTSVFLWLYIGARTHLRLLWLLGWGLTDLRVLAEWAGWWKTPGGLAVSNISMELAALMFLGSLSPVVARKINVQYIQLFSAPLVLYTLLVSLYPGPSRGLHLVILGLAAAAAAVAVFWGAQRNLLPPWFTLPYSVAAGGFCIYLTWVHEYTFTLFAAQSANNLITALLFLAAYRRLSPGTFLTVAGFFAWCAPSLLEGPMIAHGISVLAVARAVNLVKVATALGMILLVLEDELAANDATKARDHRARIELEHYAKVRVWTAPGQEQQAYDSVCHAISACSRFEQVALLLRGVEGSFYIAASSELAPEVMEAIDSFARRTTVEQMAGSPVAAQHVQIETDGNPGTAYSGLVLRNSAGLVDGILLLGGLRNPFEPLQPDEMLPIELLAARLAGGRETGALTQRILRAEKLSGLGQLAGGVAHELNNPLTAVMGYAQMIEEDATDESIRSSAVIIQQESRRMKQTIESLVRFWRPRWEKQSTFAVDQMLADMERLRGPELNRCGIQLQIRATDNLPLIRADADHICQVMLQLLNNSVMALESVPEGRERRIRIDASRTGENLRIVVSDTGCGFADLNRVFDPFYSTRPLGEGKGLGLGLCYSIIREHGGDISAVNLHPYGSAVVVELPCSSIAVPEQAGDRLLAHQDNG